MSAFDPSHGGRLIKREDGRWVLRDDLRTAEHAHHLLAADAAAKQHYGLSTGRIRGQKPGESALSASNRVLNSWLSEPGVDHHEVINSLEDRLHQTHEDGQLSKTRATEDAAEHEWESQAVDPDDHSDKRRLRGKHVWLYHGTTDKFRGDIEANGLNHDPGHWSNVGATATSRPTRGFTYLTSDANAAHNYARSAANKHGGDPMVLRIAVPFNDIKPDTDDADISSGRSQWQISRRVRSDEIKEINGQRRESHKGLYGAPTILESAPAHNRAEHPFVATIRFAGLPLINVECKKGSERSGIDPDGNPWSVTMPAHYGEFADTVGADGDPIDVYVGGNRHAPYAYLVPVARLDTGGYDEDKVFVGFNNLDEVCAAFRAAYNKPGFRFDVTQRMTIPALVEWLRDHGQKGKRIRLGVELHKSLAWAREALKALQTTMFGVSPNLQPVMKTDKNGRTERRYVKAGVDPRKADPRTIDLEDAIRAKQEAARPKPPPPPHPDPMIRQIQAEESERGKPKPAPEPETYSGPDTGTIGLPGIADPNQPSIGGRLPTPAKKFADMIDMLTARQKAETAARRASTPRTFSVHRHLGGSAA